MDAIQFVNDPDGAKLPGWNRYFEAGDPVRGIILGWRDGTASVRIGRATLEVPPASFAWAGKGIDKLLPRGASPRFFIKEEKDGLPTKIELDQEPEVEAALIAVDPKTGEIRAMVGGYDFNRSKFDRALQAQRQVGSSMKAFVYGAAFEQGKTPASMVNDVPTTFVDAEHFAVSTTPEGITTARPVARGAKAYEPKNYERDFWGPIPIWEAIRDSRNVAAVRTLEETGIQMQQIITNSTVNGFLQATFAVLTLIVVLSAIPVWIKAARSGGLPTTEIPHEPSHLVAPSDFFATAEEKQAVREYEASQRELAGSGGRR